MLFGQFDGIWGMEVMFSDQAEKETLHEPGEWAFVWVLDGRAIQDLLAYPNTNNKSNPRRIETTRNK
jgi:hypothetical protein